jgi:hypothetical protein
VRVCLRKASFCRSASRCRRPSRTSTPAAASLAYPVPSTRGFGSRMAETTRKIPASITASAHGGVRPTCEHGSSVVYSVAPFARSPACVSARISACAVPGPSCQPSPMTRSSATTTAPTAGFGETIPRPRSASPRARSIYASSDTTTFPEARNGSDRQGTAAHAAAGTARPLPSRLSRSVPESHRVHPRLAAEGSRTVTAGGESHPAPKTDFSRKYRRVDELRWTS